MLQLDIPWNKYSEEDIIVVVSQIFHQKGYVSYNNHIIDRASEDGVDIEFKKKFESERILVAVKKKPRKNDKGQLDRLASKDGYHKIYIHIAEPTVSFRQDMDKVLKKGVTFWNAEQLTKELKINCPRIFIFMMMENHVEKGLFEASKKLIQNYAELKYKTISPKKPERLSNELISLLWHGKDRSVAINKSMRAYQYAFEGMKFNNIDDSIKDSIMMGFLRSLVYISRTSIDPFLSFIDKMLSDYPGIIDTFCIQTQERSYWFALINYSPHYLPKILEKSLFNDWESSENIEISKIEMVDDGDLESILATASRILANIGDTFEDIVDGLFSIAVDGDWEWIRDTLDYNEDLATLNLDFPSDYNFRNSD